jgi:hypothetical protein
MGSSDSAASAGVEPTPDRPGVLRDDALDRQLGDQGWVKLPGPQVAEPERRMLRRFFADEFTGARAGFHNDFFLPDTAFRIRATQVMAEATYHLSQTWFRGLEPFLYTYLTKFASPDSSLLEHRDWMYVNELSGERSYILYVALDHADADSGMLHVVPRSHRLDGPPCGTRLVWPWLAYPEVLRAGAVTVPLEPGEAAVWDNRLIHMSFENTTSEDRLAMGLWCHRRGGDLAHFVGRDRTTASLYTVDEWFFMSETPELLAQRDPDHPETARITIHPGEHSPSILGHVLREGVAPAGTRPWRFDLEGPVADADRYRSDHA